ncbi:hypothetical protein BDW02DRAFT_587475 [Decorospora gaudefroyi]|uniref:Aminoglycoside phosphotransferase domain-containing protein n=1 Tax=Decorospora gaudefroyi TaxID=184978 RepID=A0A6A5KLC2_9PLEO|nr:hypothetical protein BDW02DRAFT_587475 [Decorospora gaudefroyi]
MHGLINHVYYATHGLPAPIPTPEQILTSTEYLNRNPAGCTVGVGQHFVVKYGQGMSFSEADTLRFLEIYSEVPIPRVYALFEHNDKNYMVLERIQGWTLDQAWPALKIWEKSAITWRLKSIMHNLRQLRSPGGYCSIGLHSPEGLRDHIFRPWDESKPPAGPFDRESAINTMVLTYLLKKTSSTQQTVAFCRAFDEPEDHPPTFTHGDFQRNNIMLSKDGHIILIDWSEAGYDCVDQILQPTFVEHGLFMRELWKLEGLPDLM